MSRFVSSGTSEEPTERDEAWREAQRKIDATRQQKAPVGQQEGGKSLYETLQANKAAKQEAFEEATRLRNQFRSLDEDEVEFLDSVLEQTRNKEAEVKKETKDQLAAFRKQQEEAEKAARQESSVPETQEETTTVWTVGPRKRKKAREKEGIAGVKLRRTSSADVKDGEPATAVEKPTPSSAQPELKRTPGNSPPRETVKPVVSAQSGANVPKAATAKPPSPPAPALGLGAYSSDEDD